MLMNALGTYLQRYPESLQLPFFAMFFVFSGYFIAKILAIFFSQIFQVTTVKNTETPTQGVYIIRLLFWVVWLIFIIIGLVKFPVVRGVFSNIYPKEESIWVYFAIFLGAGTFSLLSAPLKPLIGEILKPILQSPIFKTPFLRNLLGWGMLIIALVAASTSLDAPSTVQQKVAASLLLLSMGWILGLMVKETVFNLLSIFDFTYSSKEIDLSISIGIIGLQRVKKLSAPKHIYFGYVGFTLFLVAAIKLWI